MKKPKIRITTAWSVETREDSIESRCYNYVGKFIEVCKGGSFNDW